MNVPPELERSIPNRLTLEFTRRSTLVTMSVVYISLVVAMALAPVDSGRVLPAAAGPLFGALFLILRPVNPYLVWRSARDEYLRSPVARSFVEILRSRAARIRVLWVGIGLSATCGPFAYFVARVIAKPAVRAGSFDFGVLMLTAIFGWLSVGFQLHFLLRWAIREWRVNSNTDVHPIAAQSVSDR
jgi:hypothetical protein